MEIYNVQVSDRATHCATTREGSQRITWWAEQKYKKYTKYHIMRNILHYKSSAKAILNRWVFSNDLKDSIVVQFLIWVGRWFQSLGAQMTKERSPKELLDLGSWRRCREAERSPVRPGM